MTQDEAPTHIQSVAREEGRPHGVDARDESFARKVRARAGKHDERAKAVDATPEETRHELVPFDDHRVEEGEVERGAFARQVVRGFRDGVASLGLRAFCRHGKATGYRSAVYVSEVSFEPNSESIGSMFASWWLARSPARAHVYDRAHAHAHDCASDLACELADAREHALSRAHVIDCA